MPGGRFPKKIIFSKYYSTVEKISRLWEGKDRFIIYFFNEINIEVYFILEILAKNNERN
jgi:hypothetical protein